MKKLNQSFSNLTKTNKPVPVKSLSHAPELLKRLIVMKLEVMAAEVNPEHLKKLSEMVEHELSATKDTEDYNFDLVSQVIDKAFRVFTEAGQLEVKPGDVIKIQEKIINVLNSTKVTDFQEASNSGDYKTFPFSSSVEAELRSVFLLKTNRKDSIKSLLEEFRLNHQKVMSTEDFETFMKAFNQAQPRIAQQTLLFPEPIEGNEQGTLRPLSAEEKRQLSIEGDFEVDERRGTNDLLSLKELILILKGDDVHSLSIGPSFFAKYMPELQKLGVDGVICEVANRKLVQIKLAKLPVLTRPIGYSPVKAATLLHFNQKDQKNYLDAASFFVVVDGCVAIPTGKVPYEYEEFAKNDYRLAAGEVFLFEKRNEDVLQTRTCFVPHDYSPLHPFHQHGSMIFGSNDQSFQSCYGFGQDFNQGVVASYQQWWHEMVKSGKDLYGDAYKPALVAARLHYFPKDKAGKNTVLVDLFNDENKVAQELVVHSISEQTEFTKYWTLLTLPFIDKIYGGENNQEIARLTTFENPLNRRWLAKQYIKDGVGITKDKQPGFYSVLGDKMRQDTYRNNFKTFLKINHMNQLIKEGISTDEAIKRAFKFT